MTGKPKRGRPPMAAGEKRRNTINVRFDDAAHADIEQAALEAGRSQSGEIQHRVNEYQFLHRLLDDSAAIEVAVVLKNLRKIAGSRAISLESGEQLASLQQAVIAAACISELFRMVAEHTGEALVTGTRAWLADGWEKRISAGDLSDDFDVETTAAEISAKISSHTLRNGKRLASEVGPTVGPSIWDICFEKDDPLRSTSIGAGTGLMGRMSALLTSGVGLPPAFLPPPQAESERLAFVKKTKKRGAIRDAAKHQMSEGQHPGMSEDEVVDMLYDDLLKPFGMDPDEAVPDVAAG